MVSPSSPSQPGSICLCHNIKAIPIYIKIAIQLPGPKLTTNRIIITTTTRREVGQRRPTAVRPHTIGHSGAVRTASKSAFAKVGRTTRGICASSDGDDALHGNKIERTRKSFNSMRSGVDGDDAGRIGPGRLGAAKLCCRLHGAKVVHAEHGLCVCEYAIEM